MECRVPQSGACLGQGCAPAASWVWLEASHGSTYSVQGVTGASDAAKAAAEAALAAAKTAASVRAAQEHGSVTVTETRRFAGKDVQASSAVCAAYERSTPAEG